MKRVKGRNYLTTSEAAKLIGIPVATVRSYFRTGRVFKTAKKVNGTRWQISEGEALEFRDGKLSAAGAYSEERHIDDELNGKEGG